MRNPLRPFRKVSKFLRKSRNENGVAMIVTLMVLSLMGLFIAAALSLATTEATLMNNDNTNAEAFYAAQASLELMSRDFNNIFDYHLSPSSSDLSAIQADTPAITGFTFNQAVTSLDTTSTSVTISSGPFVGLNALRNRWSFTATATAGNGAQAQVTRTVNNYLVPIFQFGVFYQRDAEFHPGALFNFGGRVHTNSNLYITGSSGTGSGLYFHDRVTAAGQVVTDVLSTGQAPSAQGFSIGAVYVNPGSGAQSTWPSVSQGSVASGPDTAHTDANEPDGSVNSGWASFDTRFNGNLTAKAPALKLPLTLDGTSDPIELIRRGKSTDDAIMTSSRYYNKPGIRITLSDSQSQLPGGTGGINLTASGGYTPAARTGVSGHATQINAARFATTPGGSVPAAWIKVENVTINTSTGVVNTTDITADFLSLGLTQSATFGSTTIGDADAILKLQHYTIAGPPVRVPDVNSSSNSTSSPSTVSSKSVYSYNSTSGINYITTSNYLESGESTHSSLKTVSIGGSNVSIIPFPIEIFDTREGFYTLDMSTTTYSQ